MLQPGDKAPTYSLPPLKGGAQPLVEGKTTLLVFFETDCPTCRLMLPYLNKLATALAGSAANIMGISQDPEAPTRELVEALGISFPIFMDTDLKVSRAYDPPAVPTLFLLTEDARIIQTEVGFDKSELNAVAAATCEAAGVKPLAIASQYDGAPESKPGCASRHREPHGEGEILRPLDLHKMRGRRASRIELSDDVDPYEYCEQAGFGDALPVIPPTLERVERMLAASPLDGDEVIALVPPNYGAATVEKIAANAVMAGCRPEMMKVLITMMRAACDERFNMHGVQATTHFAAPLVIVNGPIRQELGFASASNVFSNVARANTSLGRALQLILVNLGGARPGEIDMSTLGHPGKFSYCIAENEEESPWQPLHVEKGFEGGQSTITLFAAEPPHGVSEHTARSGRGVLRAVSRALATVWSYRVCVGIEAMIVVCPEHVRTLHREGFSKNDVRQFLFENTAIPLRHYQEHGDGEGTQYVSLYKETVIDGEPCYLKFTDPSAIKIVVAGGTAGKFSAVIGSWAAGPRGSQMVTYPIVDPVT
jgi:peroxiredoxin